MQDSHQYVFLPFLCVIYSIVVSSLEIEFISTISIWSKVPIMVCGLNTRCALKHILSACPTDTLKY